MRILAPLLLYARVELSTSGGCSSCPPADALLSQIHSRTKKSGQAIYTLAVHVDYWNRLGWKDPFSDAVYSKRQNDYAAGLGEDRIYTPRMIVNGRGAFVSSEAGTATKRIDTALATAPQASVAIELQPVHDKDGSLIRLQLAATVE